MQISLWAITAVMVLSLAACSSEISATQTDTAPILTTTLTVAPTIQPTPTADLRNLPPPYAECWETAATLSLGVHSPPPEPFLYLPLVKDLNPSLWSAHLDHQAPIYQQDGVIATFGELIQYNQPGEGLAGGTQAYQGTSTNLYFPSTVPVPTIVARGYRVLAYQSALYETFLFYDGHDGNDYATTGEARAAAAGQVVYQDWMGSFGRVVEIYHPQGYITRYAHLASYADQVQLGSAVTAGQKVGVIGGSGVKNGEINETMWEVHMHFSVYRWNPAAARWSVVDPYGWDPAAGVTLEEHLKGQESDPLYQCNGEISYSLWVDGWPHPYGEPAVIAFEYPTADRYVGGWAGEMPEYPQPGGQIAFVGADRGVWIMNADGTDVRRLADSVGYSYIYWSPDGSRLAFFYYDGELKILIMDADGSNPVEVPYQPSTRNGFSDISWSPDGEMLAFSNHINERDNIYKVNRDGSGLTNLTNNTRSGYLFYIAWSPDNSQLAFLSNTLTWNTMSDLYLMNISDQSWVNVTNIFERELEGGVVHSTAAFPSNLRWSPNGEFITFTGLAQGSDYCGYLGTPDDCQETNDIFISTADGKSLRNLTGPAGSEFWYAWSPDGTRIAFESNRDGNWEIYVINPDGSGMINLSQNLANDKQPSWSANGKSIVFISDRDGNQEIYRLDLESGLQVRLTYTEGDESIPVYQPAGQ